MNEDVLQNINLRCVTFVYAVKYLFNDMKIVAFFYVAFV